MKYTISALIATRMCLLSEILISVTLKRTLCMNGTRPPRDAVRRYNVTIHDNSRYQSFIASDTSIISRLRSALFLAPFTIEMEKVQVGDRIARLRRRRRPWSRQKESLPRGLLRFVYSHFASLIRDNGTSVKRSRAPSYLVTLRWNGPACFTFMTIIPVFSSWAIFYQRTVIGEAVKNKKSEMRELRLILVEIRAVSLVNAQEFSQQH